jgi:DNA replication protein DnaC
MKHWTDIVSEALSGLTTTGIGRFKYEPYSEDIALSVIERIAKGIDPGFVLTDEARRVYTELIYWFHADDKFRGDLTKGFILMGPTGSGKTLAMKVMSIYRQIDDIKFIINKWAFRMNYEIIEVNHFVNEFLNNAFDGIESYCTRYILCIDDIGSEAERVKHYGNTLDVISYILAERYAKRLLTFGTTNFPVEILEQKYDDRTVSRMYALFNFIEVNDKDFRRVKL